MDIVGENSTLCRDIERRDMAMIGSAMCNNFLGAGEEREGRFAKGRALPYRAQV
jgi:heat shock protein HslJ